MHMDIQAGLDRQMAALEGQHWINAPSSARMLAKDAFGRLRSLATSGTDDPLLYAYEVLDQLPRIARTIVDLERVCKALTDATPDQLVDSGANPCP